MFERRWPARPAESESSSCSTYRSLGRDLLLLGVSFVFALSFLPGHGVLGGWLRRLLVPRDGSRRRSQRARTESRGHAAGLCYIAIVLHTPGSVNIDSLGTCHEKQIRPVFHVP